MKKIDVSVLITCFNKEKYLNECLTSIERQSKQPKEIIVVHDGCSEPLASVLADSIMLHENLGVANARDVAFKYSTGQLILFVDGDDVISPDYLEKMTVVISKGADIAYPDLYIWMGENSRLSITPKKITPAFVSDHQKVVIPVTSLMKREVYLRVGGFRQLPALEDLDFWIRAMCEGYTFRKAETLLWYRRTAGTRNNLDIIKLRKIFNNILDQFDITKTKISLK